MSQTALWVVFNVFVMAMLAVDLGVFNRRAHIISPREAARWTGVVVVAAALFNAGLFRFLGHQQGLEFTTGYLIELALSVDNIFVFILLFSYFRVPEKHQHRVLFWGVFGALLMRGAMIWAGAYLIERFHWILYVFGAFLVFTGIRMAMQHDEAIEPQANPLLRLLRRVMPITPSYEGQRFFSHVLLGGRTRRAATPLFVVLVLVETTDLVFAVDSIPAVFAVTTDPFIVYTSNVFAILGLRSLYFLLAHVIDRFHLLRLGLAAVLVFVGGKMLGGYFGVHVPIVVSLAVVGALLLLSVIASLVFPKREAASPSATAGTRPAPPSTPPDEAA